jgi:23S rRNA (cytidine1920-2'-O)/16S rRNA (cytidine1409-2'-O)-methyltransferase
MRIDVWLVENGKVASRQKAQELIAAGRVSLVDSNGRVTKVKKPSLKVDGLSTDGVTGLRVEIETTGEMEFVSRGGLKLKGALETTGLDLRGATVFDVGTSTGGFADCALQFGAARVVGIDVGHGQLAEKLKREMQTETSESGPRLVLFEGVNARNVTDTRDRLLEANRGHHFDFIVVDVSFISLKLVLPAVVDLLASSGQVLALVKPQFEVGREGLGKNGIVKDPRLFLDVETSIRDVCVSLGLRVEAFFASPILGSDGNKEFFIHATIPQRTLF